MLYCSECGSRHVQTLEWIDPNTGQVVGGNDCGGTDDNWCEHCETHPFLTNDRREAAAARLAVRREPRPVLAAY